MGKPLNPADATEPPDAGRKAHKNLGSCTQVAPFPLVARV